ncbi:hypothetical protein PSTG_10188 [Puccinia striiformis f. sp. tritici PST-78]|uniref:HAT C-terminal dimerisation domain-containing protein n=1 Tax=Puccinia striiformis f. sp. tritici PST-78 TaxID=1165861 RepID=A0A0L0VB30_9BASI|nr:hypothetical protein PSTG_10188 [Puccinia striiformis f. sp. tritici PST-78]
MAEIKKFLASIQRRASLDKSILRPFGKVIKKTNGNVNLNLDKESEKGSDDEDDEDAEGQICRQVQYSKDTSTRDHEDPDDIDDSEDNTDKTIETELSIEDIHDLSDEDEEQDTYTLFHAIARKLRKSPNSKADKITDHLLNAIKGGGNEYSPVLQNACRFGLQLTNTYNTLTNCSPLYWIAMVLHPSFKDKYFKIAGWEADWITEALRLTRELFNTSYKPNVNILPSSQPNKSNKPKTGNIAQLALAAQPGLSANDPLDTWLAYGLILDNGLPVNALKWWIQQKPAGNSHGGLLRMALGVLSCPVIQQVKRYTVQRRANRTQIRAELINKGHISNEGQSHSADDEGHMGVN